MTLTRLRRRDAVVGLAGALSPIVAAKAQAPLRLGWVSISPHPFIAEFRDRLKQLGYLEGKNLIIEQRYADGNAALLPGVIEDLVKSGVTILVPSGSAATDAAVAGARGVPVVFLSSDPSIAGQIASLARPGGVATGVSTMAEDIAPKKIGLMREAVQGLKRLAVLNDANPGGIQQGDALIASASGVGLESKAFPLTDPSAFDRLFGDLAAARWQSLIAVSSPLFAAHAMALASLVAKNRLPAMFDNPTFVQAGALMSYGADLAAAFRRLADLVQQVAQGRKLGDLPVERATKIVLAFNQSAAKALGLTPSLPLLASVDELVD
jgi:putative ABC transport system substrate-binding protein